MTSLGEQKLLSYQYLPITEVTLHTQQQLRSLKLKSILPEAILDCNTKMFQFINEALLQSLQKQNKNQPQIQSRIDFKKWAKQVDKICGQHAKLNEVEKIQLYNNAVMKIITSEPQLVLILSKLHSLTSKDRKALLEKCTFQ